MRSRHRKQREWYKHLRKRKADRQIKEKGVTPASAHPLEIQTLNPSRKEKGVTLGKLSNIWPSVKCRSTVQ